ncbi:hypothetical protein RRSWK_07008 [Rhodopirellula sp. SWK7]|nr:hypothetical protein RRSWK_07008 [Rhodopirellula sp. SWK7]
MGSQKPSPISFLAARMTASSDYKTRRRERNSRVQSLGGLFVPLKIFSATEITRIWW